MLVVCRWCGDLCDLCIKKSVVLQLLLGEFGVLDISREDRIYRSNLYCKPNQGLQFAAFIEPDWIQIFFSACQGLLKRVERGKSQSGLGHWKNKRASCIHGIRQVAGLPDTFTIIDDSFRISLHPFPSAEMERRCGGKSSCHSDHSRRRHCLNTLEDACIWHLDVRFNLWSSCLQNEQVSMGHWSLLNVSLNSKLRLPVKVATCEQTSIQLQDATSIRFSRNKFLDDLSDYLPHIQEAHIKFEDLLPKNPVLEISSATRKERGEPCGVWFAWGAESKVASQD